jgi:hypothetical protein
VIQWNPTACPFPHFIIIDKEKKKSAVVYGGG